MAFSKCPKCNGTLWELAEVEPGGSNFKWFFVQCSSCGAPVGVVDYFPNTTLKGRIEAVEKAVASIESQLSTIDYNIRALAQRMR